jgi:hypothetical protein
MDKTLETLEDMLDELRKSYWDIQIFNIHEEVNRWMLRVRHKDSNKLSEYKGLILRSLIWKALEKAKEYK